MLITIDKVVASKRNIDVTFSADIGAAFAVWNAPTPNLGEEYDVELNIDENFFWGGNACPSLNNTFSIKAVDNTIYITGRLISIDEYNVAVVEVGGAIVLIELFGCAEILPMFVDLKFQSLSLFPTGV